MMCERTWRHHCILHFATACRIQIVLFYTNSRTQWSLLSSNVVEKRPRSILHLKLEDHIAMRTGAWRTATFKSIKCSLFPLVTNRHVHWRENNREWTETTSILSLNNSLKPSNMYLWNHYPRCSNLNTSEYSSSLRTRHGAIQISNQESQ